MQFSWREMPVISRQIGLRHDRTSFDKKKSKKKNGAGQHMSVLHLNLKSLVRQAHERSSQLMSFRFRFFLGRAVWATSWRKTPKLVLTGCFSVSAQTSLKRYSERLLLFELSSSLSRIDDVFVNFREKKVTTRTLHWDAKTSFHLHTVAYDHARTVFLRKDVVTSNSVDLMTVLWLRDSWRLCMYTSIFRPTEHAW